MVVWLYGSVVLMVVVVVGVSGSLAIYVCEVMGVWLSESGLMSWIPLTEILLQKERGCITAL